MNKKNHIDCKESKPRRKKYAHTFFSVVSDNVYQKRI